jgi:hypothetical protein
MIDDQWLMIDDMVAQWRWDMKSRSGEAHDSESEIGINVHLEFP